MIPQQLKILLVEDDLNEARLLEESLESVYDDKLVVVHVDRLLNALLAVSDDEFDAILLDLNLPDSHGIGSVMDMVQRAENTPVIVLSSQADRELEREVILYGAQEFVEKGSVDSRVLVRLVRHAVERHSLQATLDRNLRELSALNAQFRGLMVDNGDAMIVLDGEGVARFVNPAAEDLFGRASAQLIGTMIGIPIDSRREAEMQVLRPDGTEVYIDMRVMPTLWEGKRAYLATMRDVSRVKQTEQELRSAAEAAEAASDLKSAFLANMSHELRTPLNSIIGFSELIEAESYGPLGHEKYNEYAQIVRQSGGYLLDLINDLLDLSKAEAEAIELYEAEFSLDAVIRQCVSAMMPSVEKGQLTVKNGVSPIRLVGDEKRLTQVILNLLSNAVKFTPEGGEIRIGANVTSEGDLELLVSDTGNGIAAADLPAIFGKFVQVGDEYVSKQEGTGLGLAICKTFVELHGGSIDVKSAIGAGTTVSILLPSERVLEAAVYEMPNMEAARLRGLWT